MKGRKPLSRAVATLTFLGACASLVAAQAPSCRVDLALRAKPATPLPSEFQCKTNLSCTAFIDCASNYMLTVKVGDPRRSNSLWLDNVSSSLSAVLDKLPNPQLNPDLIVYYFDFIVMIQVATQRSDQMCTEANVQIRNLGPTLLLLEKPLAERIKLLNSKQFDNLQGISDRYKHGPCYDSDVLTQAMNPPKAQTDKALTNEAALQVLTLLAQFNQQQKTPRDDTNTKNATSSALATGATK